MSTVRATRAASEDELVEQSRPRLQSLLAEGVTTVRDQVGLRAGARHRNAHAARCATPRAQHPVTVSTSLLAAHARHPNSPARG